MRSGGTPVHRLPYQHPSPMRVMPDLIRLSDMHGLGSALFFVSKC